MFHRSGEIGKKLYLNNFIFIVKIPNFEPKVFTVQCAFRLMRVRVFFSAQTLDYKYVVRSKKYDVWTNALEMT